MKIFTEDALLAEDKLYFFGRDINALFQVNLRDGNISVVGTIPGEKLRESRLCCKLAYYKNQIIVAPLRTRNIWILSLNTGTWGKIEINEYDNNYAKSYCRNIYVKEDRLLLWGGYYPGMVIVNLIDRSVSYDMNLMSLKSTSTKDLFFRSGPLNVRGKLYFASCIDNSVLIVDEARLDHAWVEVGDKRNRYSGIEWDGQYFWLSPRCDSAIVKWDGKDRIWEYEQQTDMVFDRVTYFGIVRRGDGFLIPASPNGAADSLYVDGSGQVIQEKTRYTLCKNVGEHGLLIQTAVGDIAYIDDDGVRHEILKEKNVDLSLELRTAGIDPKDYIDGIHIENENFGLRELISMV